MPRNNDRDEEREERIRQLMERARKQMPAKTGNGPGGKPKPAPPKATKPRKKAKKK